MNVFNDDVTPEDITSGCYQQATCCESQASRQLEPVLEIGAALPVACGGPLTLAQKNDLQELPKSVTRSCDTLLCLQRD
jgi:hypothetical protein